MRLQPATPEKGRHTTAVANRLVEKLRMDVDNVDGTALGV